MKMVGHKTESIYRRYAIVSESDLRDGAERIQALHDRQRKPSPLTIRARATGRAMGRRAVRW
jgi:hypothetical protein